MGLFGRFRKKESTPEEEIMRTIGSATDDSGKTIAEIEAAIAEIRNSPGAKHVAEVARKEARAVMEELERRENPEAVAQKARELREKLGIRSNETIDIQQEESDNAWDSFINSLKKKVEVENPYATRRMQAILENPVAMRELRNIYERIGTISPENCSFYGALNIELKNPGNALKKDKSYSITVSPDGSVIVHEFMLEDTGEYSKDTNMPLYRKGSTTRKIDANGIDVELSLVDEIFEGPKSKERSEIYKNMSGSKGTSISRSYKRSPKSIDDVTYEKKVIQKDGKKHTRQEMRSGQSVQVLEHTKEQMKIPGKRITTPQEIAHGLAKDTIVALNRVYSTTLFEKLAKEVSPDERDR